MDTGGLEALAGEVSPLPAKASSPLCFFHYLLSIIHSTIL
jgi:hypothetical protein